MIKVFSTEYKAIGDLTLISEKEIFNVRSPLSFSISTNDKSDSILAIGYSNYNYTFPYESYKMIIPLLDKEEHLAFIYLHNGVIPYNNKEDIRTSGSLSYELIYLLNRPDQPTEPLYLQYQSNSPIKDYIRQEYYGDA